MHQGDAVKQENDLISMQVVAGWTRKIRRCDSSYLPHKVHLQSRRHEADARTW